MLDIILIVIGLTAGLVSIFFGILNFYKEKTRLFIEFSSKDGRKLKIEADSTTPEDIEKIIIKLREADSFNSESEIAANTSCRIFKNEFGFVLSELFLYLVPGAIALLFSFTFIYLIIQNQKTPDYTIPKELSSAMTMIIGYFFGVGAASATNKGKVITPDEIDKYIQSLRK